MVHVLKVYFKDSGNEDQIRRMVVNSDVVSKFELLMGKICNLLQLSNFANLQIKWKDPEEDLILMSSDDELAQALANAEDGLLRVYVTQKNVQQKASTKFGQCGLIHPLVVCDVCDKQISGVRYKCLQCRDFDICSSCNAAAEHPHHDMIKLVKPTLIPRQWVFQGARKIWKSMFGICPATVFTFDLHGNNSSNSSDDSPCTSKENFQDKKEQEPPTTSDTCKNFPRKATSPDSTDSEIPAKDKKAKENRSKHTAGQYENPWSPSSTWPNTFLDLLKGEIPPPHSLFEDTCKIINDGLGTVFKNVQGNVEVKVDSPLFKSGFKMGQPKQEVNKDKKEESTSEQSSCNKATGSETTPSTLREKCQAATAGLKSGTTNAPNSNPDVGFCDDEMVQKETNHISAAVSQTSSSEIEKDMCSNTTGAPRVTNANEAESYTGAEGWTFLNEDGTKLSDSCVTESTSKEGVGSIYPEVKKLADFQERPNEITEDPAIVSALMTMQAMGFTNEGGWLERLLISKHGNIHETLDALYPLAPNNRP